jgi:LmbE family N-acetylglucosaminyl deacetylase
VKLNNATAEIFVPDEMSLPEAVTRTTHLCIGAHQDDLEIMAFHGIAECYGRNDRWFSGVTCTNGAGSPRAGVYAAFTDEMMQQVRKREQRLAAGVGQYAAMFQLDYPSAVIKDPESTVLADDLTAIMEAAAPDVVYTHNLADKHDTHVGVVLAALAAMRRLPAAARPKKVYGCEVWRGLDWLPDADKVSLNVSAHENLAMALTGLFDSQIAGGKRYDLATQGRRRANATYAESHGVDTADQLTFAMDLTPLVQNESLDPAEYVLGFIRKFEADIGKRLRGKPAR